MKSQRPVRRVEPSPMLLEGRCVPSALAMRSGRAAAARGAVISATDEGSAQRPIQRRYTLYRITNPTPVNARLKPPFAQVRVQASAPTPGEVYNVLFMSVRNGTNQTFDAGSGLFVRLTNQTKSHAYPILTGDELWRPGEVTVFYVLTKQYYPLSPTRSAGFAFDLNGSHGVAIPGPSGIFLRVRYNPQTFEGVLNRIVAFGPGSKGHRLGLPDTSIWEIIPARFRVIPL